MEQALRWTDIDRERVREQVTAWFDAGLTVLALLALALALLELSGTLGEPWTSRVIEAQLAI